MLALMSPNYALAEQVAFNDPDIQPNTITYPSPNGHGEVRGYLVRPTSAKARCPAVVVVHENRGLNPYIEDVARRLAKAGFIALAPDGLTSVGGYPGNDEEGARAAGSRSIREKLMNDFFAAVEFLMDHDESTGKVGIVGFCYGGGVANAAAVAYPELAAAVPFYGRQPDAGGRAAHQGAAAAALCARWTSASTPAGRPTRRRSTPTGKTYEAYIYEGVNHGFHNDYHAALRRASGRTGLGPDHRLVQHLSRLSRLTAVQHLDGEDRRQVAGDLAPALALVRGWRRPSLIGAEIDAGRIAARRRPSPGAAR